MLPPDFIIQGRYRINAVVDERPASTLYRGRDDQTGRFVLVAALRVEDDDAREDLTLAARQIATVHHGVLLPLTDHFAEGEPYYLVCDDPGGQDLDRILRFRGGALPEAEALAQIVRLLGTLEHLHSQRPQLYLGDPTPSDLWIGEDGGWRLAPFALARPIGPPSPYRAPELAELDADTNAASDLYAVGALLYYALTGSPPTTPEQQAAGAPLIGPRALNPAISLLAEQALLRALQQRPVNRYQAAREMRLALETVLVMAGRSLGLGPDVLGAAATLSAPPVPPSAPPDPGHSIGTPQPGIYPTPAPPPAPISSLEPAPLVPAVAPALVDASPLPIGGEGAAPAPRRGLSTSCLVTVAVALTLLAIAICVVGALVLVPGAPLHWLVGAGDIAPFPTAAPVSPTGAPAATPLPTAAPAQLGPRAITLQNAAQITQTREITSPVFGPVSYSPDGKLLAVAVSRVIKLNDSSSLDEVRQLTGHTGLVGTLAWSPDSATLASGAINDNIIRLWDPTTGRLLRTLEGHTGWIRSLAFSPDGKLLASGSIDKTVRLWEVATGKSLQTLTGHTDLLGGVAFSPDGKSLASGSRDGSVRVWDVTTGRQREGFKFQAPFVQGSTTVREWMTGVAYSPDGKQLVAGSTDGIVRILDPDTGEERRQLTGHTGWIVIRGIVFTSDGKTLATASIDGTIRLWNPATGEQIAKLQGHRLQIIAISFSSDGKHLVSSSDEEGRILVWDVATKEAPQGLRVGQGVIASLVFAPDNNVLGVAGFNSEIRLFSLSDRRASSALEGSRAAVQQTLAFLSDGRVVMLTDQDRVSVFGTGEAQGKSLAGLDGTPLSVTVSRNGALIAAGSDSGAILIWDAATGTARPALHGDLKAVARLAFNDDGSLLAASGLPDDQGNVSIEVWDTTTGTKRQTLVGSQRQITAMSFQPGSATLAVADLQGALRLWNGQDGQLVRTISAQQQQERFVGIAFSPDGTVLATGSLNGDIQFWNPTTGDEAAKLNIGVGSVLALAFSPDGQKLAVGVRDVTVRVFELPAR